VNERIKLLKQQAGIDFNPDQEGLDLFAELIVRECARVAFESDLTMAIGQWGADSAILKHIGVEE
jgi:hypothetical protein